MIGGQPPAARRAQAQAWAMSKRMFAQQRVNASRAAAEQVARAAAEQTERKQQELINSLYKATAEPLDCVPYKHALGAESLFLGRNWTDSQGTEHVVLQCNTLLAGSGKPAAVLLWDGGEAIWVDLVTEGVAALVKRGRVFLYSANLTLPNGAAFVVLPARFEDDKGTAGHWSFSTLASYQGKLFYVGEGSYGTFVANSQEGYFIARPSSYNSPDKHWHWYGRSSVHEADKLVFIGNSPFGRKSAGIRFLLPPAQPQQELAALRCAARDDRGDPLAIVDTLAGNRHVLIARDDTLYLVCKPNQMSDKEIATLVLPTQRAADGSMVFAGSGFFRGRNVPFEIEANDSDSDGNPLFVARANAVIDNIPMVAIALRKIEASDSGGHK